MTSNSHFLFLDDSKQDHPKRDGMKAMTAIGGVSILASQVRKLDYWITSYCLETYSLPREEAFKWSRKKDSWFDQNLDDERRKQLIKDVLRIAAEHSITGYVTVCEDGSPFLESTTSHEMCALVLTLERFHKSLNKDDTGIIIIDRPAGDYRAEQRYLEICAEMVRQGSKYQSLKQIACPVLSMPFSLSRVLQLADLVVSITTAHLTGQPRAAEFFPYVLPLLARSSSCCGGVGLKVWPNDYMNLYHWLLEDTHTGQAKHGQPYPLASEPFSASADTR